MPASASASAHRPEDLISRLSSATDDGEAKLKALRELENQIIESRTKKLSYIKLGAVPSVVSILADGSSNSLLVQSAAAIGSFDAGVKAVLDAGAFPHLFSLTSHSNDKVDIMYYGFNFEGVTRAPACICLRSVSCSVKNLSAGSFMNEVIVLPLIKLLHGSSTYVQVAALGVISNIVVNFTTPKSAFMQCGGVKQLVQLSKSMESTVRVNAVWALRNLMFLKDHRCKEEIFLELTASTLASLICDHEPSVQEQALALVRNLVDGCIDSVEYVFADDGFILHAVGRQLQTASKAEVLIQGMYILSNVASGNEFHKEAVMQQLFPQMGNDTQSIMIKLLQSNDGQLHMAAVWAVVNLAFPSSPGAFDRVVKLRNGGVISQLKNMVNDPCLDVKLRVRTVMGQFMAFGDGLT